MTGIVKIVGPRLSQNHTVPKSEAEGHSLSSFMCLRLQRAYKLNTLMGLMIASREKRYTRSNFLRARQKLFTLNRGFALLGMQSYADDFVLLLPVSTVRYGGK